MVPQTEAIFMLIALFVLFWLLSRMKRSIRKKFLPRLAKRLCSYLNKSYGYVVLMSI